MQARYVRIGHLVFRTNVGRNALKIKSVGNRGIQNRIIYVEGEHSDSFTTTTAL